MYYKEKRLLGYVISPCERGSAPYSCSYDYYYYYYYSLVLLVLPVIINTPYDYSYF